MTRRWIALLLVAVFILTGCKTKNTAEPIELVSAHAGEIVPINDPVISTYLEMPVSDSLDYLKENAYRKTKEAHDGQEIYLSWEGGSAPYTVRIGTKQDLQDAEEWTTERKRLSVGILLPNTQYWWRVTDANQTESETGSFTTGDGVRLISARKTVKADGLQNVRDLGGRKTADGKMVRYAMLYRGGLFLFPSSSIYSMNEIDEFGIERMNRLHIRTELDLRNDTDYGGQTESPLAGCEYVRHAFTGYTSIFPDVDHYDSNTAEALRSIFSLLAEKENYPVYFHCLVGQDRTGTLAYLVLGLLGVPYEEILQDYELTAFSRVGIMDREASFTFSGEQAYKEPAAFEKMHEKMMQYGNGSLSDAIADYLIQECNVSQDQIQSIRSILLEGEG